MVVAHKNFTLLFYRYFKILSRRVDLAIKTSFGAGFGHVFQNAGKMGALFAIIGADQ